MSIYSGTIAMWCESQLCATLIMSFLMTLSASVNSTEDSTEQFDDNFILVSDFDAIFQVSIETEKKRKLPISEVGHPRAVCYDWMSRDVYWSTNNSVIWKYSFTNLSSTVVHFDPSRLSVYEDLTVDVSRRKLFFTDSGRGRVGEIDVDNLLASWNNSRSIDSDNQSKPTAIALDSTNQLLYWTDCASLHPAVYVCPINNGTKRKAIETELKQPKALDIDLPQQLLYVGDAGLLNVRRYQLPRDGPAAGGAGYQQRGHTLISSVEPKSLAITNNNSKLFFINSRATYGHSLEVSSAGNWNKQLSLRLAVSEFTNPLDIAVYISAEVNRSAPSHVKVVTPSDQSTTQPVSERQQTTSNTTLNDATASVLVITVVSVVGSVCILVFIVTIAGVICRRQHTDRPTATVEASGKFKSRRPSSLLSRYTSPPPLPPLRSPEGATGVPSAVHSLGVVTSTDSMYDDCQLANVDELYDDTNNDNSGGQYLTTDNLSNAPTPGSSGHVTLSQHAISSDQHAATYTRIIASMYDDGDGECRDVLPYDSVFNTRTAGGPNPMTVSQHAPGSDQFATTYMRIIPSMYGDEGGGNQDVYDDCS